MLSGMQSQFCDRVPVLWLRAQDIVFPIPCFFLYFCTFVSIYNSRFFLWLTDRKWSRECSPGSVIPVPWHCVSVSEFLLVFLSLLFQVIIAGFFVTVTVTRTGTGIGTWTRNRDRPCGGAFIRVLKRPRFSIKGNIYIYIFYIFFVESMLPMLSVQCSFLHYHVITTMVLPYVFPVLLWPSLCSTIYHLLAPVTTVIPVCTVWPLGHVITPPMFTMVSGLFMTYGQICLPRSGHKAMLSTGNL